MISPVFDTRIQHPESNIMFLSKILFVGSLILAIFSLTTAQASVSGSISYSTSASNSSPWTIPAGSMSVSVSFSHNISGTATITSPGGGVVATIGMSGGSVRLREVGTYSVSESYHLELTGEAYGRSSKVEDDASDQWSFSNSTPGAIGTFKVSSGLSLSVAGSSSNISVSVSGSGASATNTKDIPPGGSAWASLGGTWYVNTSMSVEGPSTTEIVTVDTEAGTVEINTNLGEATFSLSGPESFSGSGRFQRWTDMPAGTYTVTYGDVPGYETPPSETRTLTLGGTISFTGTYTAVPQVGIEVRMNLDEATFSLSGSGSYSGSGRLWKETKAPEGEYTITYGDVPGYETPPSETKTLTPGTIIIFTGEYMGIGTIEVYANLASATFSLSGPASYSGVGESWVQIGAPEGEYTITYGDVPGYGRPPSETKTLTPGGTLSFTGNYRDTGTIEVHTNMASATFELSGPASYSGSGKSWTETKASAGEYTITYSYVFGYRTPPSETKTLTLGGTISFTGVYRGLGTMEVHTNLASATFKAGDTIVVSMLGDAGGTAMFSITGIVSDVSMTESASTPGSYTGEYLVPEGLNAMGVIVSVKLVGAGGIETTDGDKTATIDTRPPAIESVDISGSPVRKAGDVITVRLLGEPGGVATFSIADVAQDIPMLESMDLPGTYEGSYTTVEGVNVKEAKVVVRLADAVGNTSADESKTASISTAPWDVNGDGMVDFLDIEAVGSNLGCKHPTPEVDINNDGSVDALDLALVSIYFGEEYGRDGELLAAARPLSQEDLARFASPYYLFQNYPNPYNPGTWIPFILAEGGEVVITIYSATGQLIRRLDLGYNDPGIHISSDRAAYWDGKSEEGEEVASGLYFYSIKAGDYIATRKMVITR